MLAGGENVFSFLNVWFHSAERCCNILKAERDNKKHNISTNRVCLCSLCWSCHYTTVVAIFQSQTFRCASGNLLRLFYKSKKKKDRKKNHIFRTESDKQSTHSFLETSVGLKAWSCLTCIISPSTHQSVTVLLCEAVLLKIYSDLNKGLKSQGNEKQKQKKPWVAQTD